MVILLSVLNSLLVKCGFSNSGYDYFLYLLDVFESNAGNSSNWPNRTLCSACSLFQSSKIVFSRAWATADIFSVKICSRRNGRLLKRMKYILYYIEESKFFESFPGFFYSSNFPQWLSSNYYTNTSNGPLNSSDHWHLTYAMSQQYYLFLPWRKESSLINNHVRIISDYLSAMVLYKSHVLAPFWFKNGEKYYFWWFFKLGPSVTETRHCIVLSQHYRKGNLTTIVQFDGDKKRQQLNCKKWV